MNSLNRLWAMRLVKAKPPVKLTLYTLLSHSDENGVSHPSLKTLALETGHGISTVLRALAKAKELGLVSWTQGSKARHTANEYRLIGLPPTLTTAVAYSQGDHTPTLPVNIQEDIEKKDIQDGQIDNLNRKYITMSNLLNDLELEKKDIRAWVAAAHGMSVGQVQAALASGVRRPEDLERCRAS